MILIVEDNLTQQKVLAYLAKHHGYDVRIVSTGREAISELQKSNQFELLLMDWSLPDMTGLECTIAIRNCEKEGEHIPIVAMTGHTLDGDREKCLMAGMDDYLSKPFSATDLRELLDRWLPSQSESKDSLDSFRPTTYSFHPGLAGRETHPGSHQ